MFRTMLGTATVVLSRWIWQVTQLPTVSDVQVE
jgi:hypothetical protein